MSFLPAATASSLLKTSVSANQASGCTFKQSPRRVQAVSRKRSETNKPVENRGRAGWRKFSTVFGDARSRQAESDVARVSRGAFFGSDGNQNRALAFCFDALSLREAAPASLESATAVGAGLVKGGHAPSA